MEEDANSWIRRTNFSHTVCHRLDSTRLAPFPVTISPERYAGLKSRPGRGSLIHRQEPSDQRAKRNAFTNKQRSLSPQPESKLSDAFKEARSDRKRFSTPVPRRKEHEKGLMGKLFSKDSQDPKARNSNKQLNTSPLWQLPSMKNHDKAKFRREPSWIKYFDHTGGRVTAVEAADEWMADLSKLYLGCRFSHGAHSRLYHGVYEEQPVAVKVIMVPDEDENGVLASKLEKQFNGEVSCLSQLHHQNVIKFVAAWRRSPVFVVITEYLSEGSLRAYLHKLRPMSLSLEKLIAIALDIARGMEYIHSQGIIHRDLKPENILVTKEFHMKIADFGIACEEAYCDSLADDPGTYRWMAPEMIKHKSYGRKVDVYSFGLILWEMVAGTIPYEDMAPIQAAFAVVNKNLRPVIPVDCPPAMRALIEQCWSLHPDKRPEFWQIVKVLEQFESSLAVDGTLNLVQYATCQDHKKGLLHWIQKLGPVHHNTSSMPKPKFT